MYRYFRNKSSFESNRKYWKFFIKNALSVCPNLGIFQIINTNWENYILQEKFFGVSHRKSFVVRRRWRTRSQLSLFCSFFILFLDVSLCPWFRRQVSFFFPFFRCSMLPGVSWISLSSYPDVQFASLELQTLKFAYYQLSSVCCHRCRRHREKLGYNVIPCSGEIELSCRTPDRHKFADSYRQFFRTPVKLALHFFQFQVLSRVPLASQIVPRMPVGFRNSSGEISGKNDISKICGANFISCSATCVTQTTVSCGSRRVL